MKETYAEERIRTRVVELFQEGRDEESRERLSLGELVREGARLMLETALEMEVEGFLGRGRYERGDRRRRGYRNGVSARTVKTLAGEVTVHKPKVRDTDEPFESEILRAWQRRCDELSALIPGLYLEGLSTRDFRRVLQTFWGEAGLSRTTISRLNKRLHAEFEAWRGSVPKLVEKGGVPIRVSGQVTRPPSRGQVAGARFGFGRPARSIAPPSPG